MEINSNFENSNDIISPLELVNNLCSRFFRFTQVKLWNIRTYTQTQVHEAFKLTFIRSKMYYFYTFFVILEIYGSYNFERNQRLEKNEQLSTGY